MKTNRHIIKITLQTPLAIGNDKSDQLSPLCDFIIKGREVMYIDPDRLGKLVLEKGLMDEFVRESGQLSNTRTNFQLEQFIKSNLGADPGKLLLSKIPIRGRPDRRIYIRPLLKSGGRPFIPGSTVKGALKTALLYYWLCNTQRGKSRLSQVMGMIRSSQGFDTLKKTLNDATEDLFGRLGAKKDSLQDFFCLRISDSKTLETNDIVISEVKRLHLKKAKLGMPQYLETLKENVSAELEISVLPGIRHLDLEFLNQPEPGKLWDILNEFSKASVETDRDILDSHAGILENDEIAREVYDSLVDFFEHLSGNIGKEIKTAHMRLGFGKTYFDNSLGLAIYRESPEIFMKYVKLFRLGKPRQTEFPVTRTVCTEPLVPMGWVTLKY